MLAAGIFIGVALFLALPETEENAGPATLRGAPNSGPIDSGEAKGPTASLPAAALRKLVLDESESASIPDSFFASLPNSLASAGRPAPLAHGSSGEFIADIRLRRMFDYYLSAIGEEPLEHIVARIRYDLRQQLADDDFERALLLLEDYLQYRNEIGNLVEQYNTQNAAYGPTDLEQLLHAKRLMKELRADYLPDNVAEAFFAEEDAYDNYMLAQADILRDNTRSVEEKRVAIALLEQQHESTLPISRQRNNTVASLRQSEASLRKRGANKDELFALRAEKVGADAAERLAQLDQERESWNARLETYHSELRVIEADSQYPESERNRLISELRKTHFTDTESKRVDALDRARAER